MYVLAVDIGNTTISAALYADKECKATLRLPSDISWEQAQLTARFERLLQQNIVAPEQLSGAVMASVVPPCTTLVQNAIRSLTGIETLVITANAPSGIDLSRYDAAHLGTDRIVDMAAAASLYDGPVAVWDLGTATTLSVIDKDRVMVGGMISPGVELGMRALHEHTAQLPEVTPRHCPTLLGLDTESNMRSGSVAATGLMISAAADYIERTYQLSGLHVVLTGGHAEYVLPWIKRENITYVRDLQLRGLLAMWLYQNHPTVES